MLITMYGFTGLPAVQRLGAVMQTMPTLLKIV
jgi:hypothetical protein